MPWQRTITTFLFVLLRHVLIIESVKIKIISIILYYISKQKDSAWSPTLCALNACIITATVIVLNASQPKACKRHEDWGLSPSTPATCRSNSQLVAFDIPHVKLLLLFIRNATNAVQYIKYNELKYNTANKTTPNSRLNTHSWTVSK